MSNESWDLLEQSLRRSEGAAVVEDSKGNKYITAQGKPMLNVTKQARKRAKKFLEEKYNEGN